MNSMSDHAVRGWHTNRRAFAARGSTAPAAAQPSALARLCASHLIGMTASDWFHLLGDNRFRVAPGFLPRALIITAASIMNCLCGPFEARRLAALPALDPRQADPLFILGHWRSGTTLLHNFLAADPRLGAPDLCQALCPRSFLAASPWLRPVLSRSLPAERLIDNMPMDAALPQEDEFALAALTGLSPYLAYAFPHRWQHYDQTLTFEGVAQVDVRRWQDAFHDYAIKLARVHGKQLVLKSPPHTARLRLLLEIFPNARFVHIRRNPYDVFRSTCHMLSIGPRLGQLQRFDFSRLEDMVLHRYEAMYDAFLAQRSLIPAGRFHQVRFEDLVRDPLSELAPLYARLGLPDFAEVAPAMRLSADNLEGYRRNRYPPLPMPLARRIAGRWARFFHAWDYPLDPPVETAAT